MSKFFDKRIEEDKKKFSEDMEYARVNCPEVYERIKEIEQEAREIMEKEGLAAALKFIVNSKFRKEETV